MTCAKNPYQCDCPDCYEMMAAECAADCAAEAANERALYGGDYDPRLQDETDRELAIEDALYGTFRNGYYGG